jgi:plasmid stability protein
MATLTIRRLDEDIYERLRERARDNGRSLEAEVRKS